MKSLSALFHRFGFGCVAEGGASDAVQQSQVSSSKPTLIANDILGPLLLEVGHLNHHSESEVGVESKR